MLRAKSRSVNNTVYVNNRLVNFVKNPSKTLDVIVERDEKIHNDLTIGNNLTVGNDLRAKNIYANGGNFFLDSYLLIPYGTIIQSAAINLPEGWLDCNGAITLKTTYTNLFNAIGYTYSTDFSGSDLSFNVPDLQGRVAVGAGAGAGLTSRTLGDISGEETHVLTTGEMPSHNHGVTDPGHAHSYVNNVNDQNTDNAFATETAADQVDLNQTTGSNTTGISINNTGGGQAHNVMQPYVVLRYFIKY
jgi:microcystin-dependent protein